MEDNRGNLFLAILAGLIGILLGGVFYLLISKMGRLAVISTLSGVILSFKFFTHIRKEKPSFLIIFIFMILNLVTVFSADAILFADIVTKEYAVTFSNAFWGYFDFLQTEGLDFYDYVNIIIIIVGTIFFVKEYEREQLAKELPENLSEEKDKENDVFEEKTELDEEN